YWSACGVNQSVGCQSVALARCCASGLRLGLNGRYDQPGFSRCRVAGVGDSDSALSGICQKPAAVNLNLALLRLYNSYGNKARLYGPCCFWAIGNINPFWRPI